MRNLAPLVLALSLLPAIFDVEQAYAEECPVRVNEIAGSDGLVNTEDEAFVYSRHVDHKLLRCVDTNLNGEVDSGSEANKFAELTNQQIGDSVSAEAVKDTLTSRILFKDPASVAELKQEMAAEAERKKKAKEKKNKKQDPTGLYIANSRFDLQSYTYEEDTKKSLKGASISYRDNQLTGTKTGKLKGAVGYRFNISNFRDLQEDEQPDSIGFYDIFLAPRVSFDGEINNTQSETSTLIAALDIGTHLNNIGPFNTQFFLISPYYQTDFRFEAEAYGLEASWEPRIDDWQLGSFTTNDTILPSFFDGYWRFNLEADALSVEKAGRTKLTDNTEYFWLGGTVALYWQPFYDYFFEKNFSPYGIAKYSHYWDASSGMEISLYDLTLGLNLDKENSTALTLNYKNGTQKSDLSEKDELTLGFNIKY